MAYGIKEQECRLDLFKKHTGNRLRNLFFNLKSITKI